MLPYCMRASMHALTSCSRVEQHMCAAALQATVVPRASRRHCIKCRAPCHACPVRLPPMKACLPTTTCGLRLQSQSKAYDPSPQGHLSHACARLRIPYGFVQYFVVDYFSHKYSFGSSTSQQTRTHTLVIRQTSHTEHCLCGEDTGGTGSGAPKEPETAVGMLFDASPHCCRTSSVPTCSVACCAARRCASVASCCSVASRCTLAATSRCRNATDSGRRFAGSAPFETAWFRNQSSTEDPECPDPTGSCAMQKRAPYRSQKKTLLGSHVQFSSLRMRFSNLSEFKIT